jgi:Na+-driven multidrug efflux pump
VLAVGAFGIVALKQLGSALTARQKPTLASAAISSAFASTVVLDFLLIPDHGGLGAAVASAVSYTLGGVVVIAVFLSALGGTVREFVPSRGDAHDAWRLVMRSVRRPAAADAAADPVLSEPVDPVEPLGGG